MIFKLMSSLKSLVSSVEGFSSDLKQSPRSFSDLYSWFCAIYQIEIISLFRNKENRFITSSLLVFVGRQEKP